MKTSISKTWSAAELAQRWNIHSSSVVRVMRRYGISGLKFGTSKQAARRFTTQQVETVEKLAGLDPEASQA